MTARRPPLRRPTAFISSANVGVPGPTLGGSRRSRRPHVRCGCAWAATLAVGSQPHPWVRASAEGCRRLAALPDCNDGLTHRRSRRRSERQHQGSPPAEGPSDNYSARTRVATCPEPGDVRKIIHWIRSYFITSLLFFKTLIVSKYQTELQSYF